MARGINKLILIGDPGQDPEVRFMPSGNPVANIRIATTDTWVDRQAPGAHREAQPGALQPAGRTSWPRSPSRTS